MQWVPQSLGLSLQARLSLGNRYVAQALDELIKIAMQTFPQIDTPFEEWAPLRVQEGGSPQRELLQYLEQLSILQPRTSEEISQLWEALGLTTLKGSLIQGRGFTIQQDSDVGVPRYSQDLIYSWGLPYYRTDSLHEIGYQSSNNVQNAVSSKVQEIFSVSEDDEGFYERFLIGVVLQRYPIGSLTGTPADYYEQTNSRTALLAYDIYTGRLEQIADFQYGIMPKGVFISPSNFYDHLSGARQGMVVLSIGETSSPTFNYPLGI